MLATASSLNTDQRRTPVRGDSRVRGGRVHSMGARPGRIATVAREAQKAAPRTGGVSSTERTLPGCFDARSAARLVTTRRDSSDGQHWLQ